MSERRAPAWLGELQARFGEMLRSPLDRSTGRLRALPERYPARLVSEVRPGERASAAARLAVYNRQYWFRLFSVLQASCPMTVRLLGHWQFNEHAARFLSDRPPGPELTLLAQGFAEFLGEQQLPQAILEAARIDDAHRRLARAPFRAPFRPGPADAARLLTGRLVPSSTVAIVQEHWPLCELRGELLAHEGASEAPILLPAPLPEPSFWLLVRDAEQLRSSRLEAQEAALLELLSTYPVGEALAQLEAQCPGAERAALPARAQRWLARSVECGFWSALSDPDGSLEPSA